MCNFLCYFKNLSFNMKTAFATFLGNFSENWATFNSSVWSRWTNKRALTSCSEKKSLKKQASRPRRSSPIAKGNSMRIPTSMVYFTPTHSTQMTNAIMKQPIPPTPVAGCRKGEVQAYWEVVFLPMITYYQEEEKTFFTTPINDHRQLLFMQNQIRSKVVTSSGHFFR